MKKHYTLTITFLLSISGFISRFQGQKMKEIAYDKDYVIEKGLIDENGQREGEWKFYYKSGELMQTGKYEKGKEAGEWKTFYPNGIIRRIGKFLNGKQNGEWKDYYKNGGLYEIGVYDGENRIG